MGIRLDILILKILSNNTFHGHQIITELKEQSDSFFSLQSGTVYPILQSMENRGLISSQTIPIANRERKVYNITSVGITYLDTEVQKWHDYCDAVEKVIAKNKV